MEVKCLSDLDKVKKTCIRAGCSIKFTNEIVKIILEKIYNEIVLEKYII